MLKCKEYRVYKQSRVKDPSIYFLTVDEILKKTSLAGWLFQNGLLNLLLKNLTLAVVRAWIWLLYGYDLYDSSFLVTSCSSKSFPAFSVLFPVTSRKEGWPSSLKQILSHFTLWLLFTKQQNMGIFDAFTRSFLASLSFLQKVRTLPRTIKLWNVSQRRWLAYSSWVIQNFDEQIICVHRVGTNPVSSEAGAQWPILNLFYFWFLTLTDERHKFINSSDFFVLSPQRNPRGQLVLQPIRIIEISASLRCWAFYDTSQPGLYHLHQAYTSFRNFKD